MLRAITIARNTFTEAIRQPIFFIILMLMSVLIALGPAFSFFTLMQGDRLLIDTGLATMLLSSLLLGVFSASGVVTREIENKTAATILSKPTDRITFIVGKYLGIAATLVIAIYIMSIIYLITLRYGVKLAAYEAPDHPVILFLVLAFFLTVLLGAVANFFFGSNFSSSAVMFALPVFTGCFLIICFVGPDWSLQTFGEKMRWPLLLGSLHVVFAALVLTAVAVALSTRLHLVASLTITFLFFALSLMSDYLFQGLAEKNFAVRIVYAAVPNLQYFWISDALIKGQAISATYVLASFGYMIVMVTALLAFGAYLFEEKELA